MCPEQGEAPNLGNMINYACLVSQTRPGFATPGVSAQTCQDLPNALPKSAPAMVGPSGFEPRSH